MPLNEELTGSRSFAVLGVAVLCLLGMACAGGDSGPPEGSPEWNMNAAIDNHAIPEYVKVVEQLKQAMNAEGELGQRATLWRAAITAGLARGYDELAGAFVEGMEANEARVEEFQPIVNDYRRRTRVNAIEFSEGVGKIKEILDAQESVALDFPLPEGNGTPSTVLSTIKVGNRVDAELPATEDTTLAWGIFSVLSDFTGGTDAAGLIDSAAGGGIQADSAQTAFGVARILLDISIMFDREGLDDPRVRKFIFEMSEKWAEPHLENEEWADLVEDYEFEAENERRDMAGKRRIKRD